jgi:hypothetical protein
MFSRLGGWRLSEKEALPRSLSEIDSAVCRIKNLATCQCV